MQSLWKSQPSVANLKTRNGLSKYSIYALKVGLTPLAFFAVSVYFSHLTWRFSENEIRVDSKNKVF